MKLNLSGNSEKENLQLSIPEKIASIVILVECLLCYNNYNGLHISGGLYHDRFRWLDIKESYFGDTPEIFFAIIMAGYIASYGNKNKNLILEKIKLFLPEISATLISTYYSLGESLIPSLLPGTPDLKDIPAVLITSAVSPILANYIRRNREQLVKILKKKLF